MNTGKEESGISLGTLVGDRIVPPEDVRPYLIRWVPDHGQVKQAIVHRTDQLRIHRLRPRATSRAADVVTTLPLDLAGVQALESVIRDLYLLGSLADGEGDGEQIRERLREREKENGGGLGDWVPARPEDEPRVPDIYRRRWQNQPDALLALIRGALRLETVIETSEEEWEVFEESLDFDDADREAEQEEGEETPPRSKRHHRWSGTSLAATGTRSYACCGAEPTSSRTYRIPPLPISASSQSSGCTSESSAHRSRLMIAWRRSSRRKSCSGKSSLSSMHTSAKDRDASRSVWRPPGSTSRSASQRALCGRRSSGSNSKHSPTATAH